MPKIEIDVDQVLTVAAAIEAFPGDKLLVMNNVVIGAVAATERRVFEIEPPDEPAAADITQRTTGLKKRTAILAALRREGPQTARELNKSLGFKVAGSMNVLRMNGSVTPLSEDRFPKYRASGRANGAN